MLLDMKPRIAEPELQELLGYAVFPEQTALDRATHSYLAEETNKLLGLIDEEADMPIGLIGYRVDETNQLQLLHISVHPEYRGQGYGRLLVLEVLTKENPERIIAETDEEAVDFYRNIGFVVASKGELPNGIERFRCVYEVEEEDEDEA
ncbi:GNAT family N-acetyltransferase [Paenibacillus sp. CAA11]|uniref:GNAT family N-acetyltransferase n=1 Tax=Paenibacillus sp. CAA11 TaxID=1532905 RepID=UPI000D3BE626|nr:GNAT family N-acetyltransferase [Paenibacillus sp. CAA11]AWB44235.1 GNAT family N-acetyltransferase [Paenibacillus sp. CAA11]